MYALLMRKKWKQTEPFLTPTLVNYYLQATAGVIKNSAFPYKIDAIVIFPGYLSKSNTNIKRFWFKFFYNVNKKVDFLIAEGMNGNSKKSLGLTLKDNVKEIKKYTKSTPLLIPSSKDHSKSIFFLQYKDASSMNNLKKFFEDYHLDSIFGKEIDNELKEDKKELMKKIHNETYERIAKENFERIVKENFERIVKENFETKAILVGSSNLSYQTYYKSPADKGEKDVFLFDANLDDKEEIEFKEKIKKIIPSAPEILLFKEVGKFDLNKMMSDEIDELESFYGL